MSVSGTLVAVTDGKMPLRAKVATSVSRTAAALSRAAGRGDGSVIGGWIGLKIDPDLLKNLAAGRAAFDANDAPAAIIALDAFSARVSASTNAQVPDRWRAQRDLDNIAGDLLGEAAALRFLLGRL